MGYWFNDSDDMKTVKSHVGGRRIPDSIREEAKCEYRKRRKQEGVSDSEIAKELFDLDY